MKKNMRVSAKTILPACSPTTLASPPRSIFLSLVTMLQQAADIQQWPSAILQVCIVVCIYVCMSTCIYIQVCMYTYVYMDICTDIYIDIYIL